MTLVQNYQTKRVLGAILNLIRYKPVATLEEANVRLQLIDQIVFEAFTDVKKPDFVGSKGFRALAPRSAGGKQRAILVAKGRSAIAALTAKKRKFA
jgi:hypothetical protein